jgi:hypothetical protein
VCGEGFGWDGKSYYLEKKTRGSVWGDSIIILHDLENYSEHLLLTLCRVVFG